MGKGGRSIKPEIAQKRHILKTITWRIVGTFDTIMIGWFLTGDATLGLSIGAIETFSKMLLYYMHERIWYKNDFGVKRNEK